ncbi:hypothetical protein ACFQGT_00125 [Natrialbaceae archaeon GCM10025810]
MSTNSDHSVAEAARGEMGYETFEGQFGNEQSASIPCQLRFTETPDQDTGRFHDALESRGFSPLDHEPDRIWADKDERGRGDRPYYEGEVCQRETYRRIRVLVMRGNVVRIYPREDEPTVEDLRALIEALEEGFDAPLEHDPIERGGNA